MKGSYLGPAFEQAEIRAAPAGRGALFRYDDEAA